jgi:hypothetical protein
VQDFFTENWKIFWKEIQEDGIPWKGIPCSPIGRFHIVKTAIYPK